jgi:dCTP deaminase
MASSSQETKGNSPEFVTGNYIIKHPEEFFETDYFDSKFAKGEKGEDQAYYRLRLGADFYISTKDKPQKLGDGEILVIKPGEFALLTTHERLKLTPYYLGFISMRFLPKARGLINISGFHVDPGFKGLLIFSVYNAGPRDVAFRYKDPIFMVIFARLAEKVEYMGPHQNQLEIPVDMITSLRGAPVSPRALQNQVDRLKLELRIYTSIILALFGALLSILLGVRLR